MVTHFKPEPVEGMGYNDKERHWNTWDDTSRHEPDVPSIKVIDELEVRECVSILVIIDSGTAIQV